MCPPRRASWQEADGGAERDIGDATAPRQASVVCESHAVVRAQPNVLAHRHRGMAKLVEERIENPRGNDDQQEVRQRTVDRNLDLTPTVSERLDPKRGYTPVKALSTSGGISVTLCSSALEWPCGIGNWRGGMRRRASGSNDTLGDWCDAKLLPRIAVFGARFYDFLSGNVSHKRRLLGEPDQLQEALVRQNPD